MKDKLCIGKIVKPQGLKGELKVAPETDVPAVFSNIKTVYIDAKPHKASRFVFRLGFAYLQLEGVDRIEEAEFFRNKKVFVDRSVFSSMDSETYLVADLVGMQLVDEVGRQIGKVGDVENYGSIDILIVYADGRLYQVPFLKEVFLDVNKRSRTITISKRHFDQNKVIG